MKGYKGMNPDMTCLGMQYEIGETYYAGGDIELCRNGLHFCERLVDVFNYYHKDESRFFYVESGGYVKTDGVKYVTSKLTILSEVPEKEVNRTFYSYRHCSSKVYDDGNGYNCGDYNGNGYGDGNCYSDGTGLGNGYGNYYGDGHGNGSGDCKGNGYGYGDGRNIQRILIFY